MAQFFVKGKQTFFELITRKRVDLKIYFGTFAS